MISFPQAPGTRRLMALGLLALPVALGAQTVQPSDWKRANEAVAGFARGHADVLKWEQSQAGTPSSANPAPPGMAIASAEQAAHLAWGLHRDLQTVQATVGPAGVALIAQGHWEGLDPGLQRRTDDVDELLAVAAQARKAWLQAVAAQQVLKPLQERLDAAEAAHELGQRMVAVGNWSQLQLAPVQLAQAAAQAELARARYALAQANHNLVRLLPQTGGAPALALPHVLPDLSAQPPSATQVDQRLQALHRHWPRAEGQRHARAVQLARAAQQASREVALSHQTGVLPVRRLMVEETQLHYNGMLKSVWDLLTEVGNLSQATVAAINAQRDALLAENDLNWALQGGLPESLVTLGGSGGEAAAAAGH